jgi:hypothetical protein
MGGGGADKQCCSLSPLHSRPASAAMRSFVLVLLGHIKASGIYGQLDGIGEVKMEL